jgi:hypothetical protein
LISMLKCVGEFAYLDSPGILSSYAGLQN